MIDNSYGLSKYKTTSNLVNLFVSLVLSLLPQLSSTQCPKVQKFASEYSCSLGPVQGIQNDITCSTIATHTKFTISTWIRFPSNWAHYGIANGQQTAIFSFKSASETNPRLALTYLQNAGSTGGLNVIFGQNVGTVNQVLLPHKESQLKYCAKEWLMVLISVDYDPSISLSTMHLVYLSKSDTPNDAPFISSVIPTYLSGLVTTPTTLAMNYDISLNPMQTNMKLFIGGGGVGGGGFTAGGCFQVSSVYFMPDYTPTGISLDGTDPVAYSDFIYGHFQGRQPSLGGLGSSIFNTYWGELGNLGSYVTQKALADKTLQSQTYDGKVFDYGIRIKNVGATYLVRECTVPQTMIDSWTNSNNAFFQRGIQVGLGDFIECVGWEKRWDESSQGYTNSYRIGRKDGQVQSQNHREFGMLGDFILHFKFTLLANFASSLTTAKLDYYDVAGFWVSSREGKVNLGEQNKGGVTDRLFQRLGVRVTKLLGIELVIMGREYPLAGITLTQGTGYALTLNFLEIEDGQGTGPLRFRRLVHIYLNEVLQTALSFITDIDFAPLFDTKNAAFTHHFFVGDMISRGFNRFNFVGQFPHPMASKAQVNTDERTFATPIIQLHDLLGYQNTTVTKIPQLLQSNCRLGVAGFRDCLLCNNLYVLDTDYRCQLKSTLPSWTVYMDNHNIFMECGKGLFFQTTLNFCQNCPLGCVECTALNVCSIISLGCPSNCKKCTSPGGVCQECNSGYTLSGGGVCLQCLRVNCIQCPASNLNTCTKCIPGQYFDQASTSCQNCDSNCVTCEGKSTFCLSCSNSRYLNIDNTCTNLASNFFKWPSTEIVRRCFPTCSTCISPLIDECTSCLTNYVRLYSSTQVLGSRANHRCSIICPDTHYLSDSYLSVVNHVTDRFCLPCDTKILNCEICKQYNPAETKIICKRCKPGFFVQVDTTSGFVNTCALCSTNCATCVNTLDDCLTCKAGFSIEFDANLGINKCVPTTLEFPVTNLKCEGHRFKHNGQCNDICPVGTFKRTIGTDDCADCRFNIAGSFACHNITAVNTNCWSDHKTNGAQCFDCIGNVYQCCPVATQGINNGICQACSDANCQTCYTFEFCTECNAGFYAASDGSCRAIISNCDLYSFQGTSCSVCTGTNALSSGSCVASCTALTSNIFWKNSVLECANCHYLCGQCSSASLNTNCLSSGNPQCITGSIPNGQGGCIECLNRQNCLTFSPGTCNCQAGQCAPTLRQVNNVCYANCPEGYFDLTGTCTACYGCVSCFGTSSNSCFTPVRCLDSKVKLLDTINSTGNYGCCDFGQYFDGTLCQNCVANCRVCSGSGAALCTYGQAGFFPNGAVMTACSGLMGFCTNAGTTLDFRETCTSRTIAYLNGSDTWVRSCGAAVGGTCSFALEDATGVNCVVCTAGNFLNTQAVPSACVGAGACPAGFTGVTSSYIHKGFEYRGGICLPTLTNCATFDEFHSFGCLTCNPGYFLFKSTNFYDYFSTVGAVKWEPKELSFCGKCHSKCLTCSSYSPYACLSCNSPTVLFQGLCMDVCPDGYFNNANVCDLNLVNTDGKEYMIPGITISSYKRCPIEYTYPPAPIVVGAINYAANLAWFANNSTKACEPCHVDCHICYGSANNNCRSCQEKNFRYANFDGECVACPKPGHPSSAGELYMIDRFTGFSCSRIQGVNYNNAGVYIQKTIPTDTVTTTLNFNPTLTENRLCYKILITFDLKLNGGATWDNSRVSVKFNGNVVWNYHFNIWDFRNYDNTIVPHELLYNKVYIDNPRCTIQTGSVELLHNVAAFNPGDYFGIRNLRLNYFLCPIKCESCISSETCEKCQDGLLFYSKAFDPPTNTAFDFFCNLPYKDLKTDDNSIYETKSLLFKPQSFFIFFKQEMNFTKEVDKFGKYYIPKLIIDRSKSKLTSRLLEDIVDVSDKVKMIVRASNLLEIEVDGYSEFAPVTAKLTFKYPLLAKSTPEAEGYAPFGYLYTETSPIEAAMVANRLLNTTLTIPSTKITTMLQNDGFIYTFLALLIFAAFTDGFNFMTISVFQKLYLLLFLNMTQFEDSQNLLKSLSKFFFMAPFSPIRFFTFSMSDIVSVRIPGLEYFQKSDYETYYTLFSEEESIDDDFLNFIPAFRLGEFGMRKSFLLNVFLVIAVLLVLILICINICILRCYISCFCKYRKKLVETVDKFYTFFRSKIFFRFLLITTVPIMFFTFGNLTFIQTTDMAGKISFFAMIAISGLYFLLLLTITVSIFLHPHPMDMDSTQACMARRKRFAQYFDAVFIPYLKNPDPAEIKKKEKEDQMVVKPVRRQNYGLKADKNIGKDFRIVSQSKYFGERFDKNEKIQILKNDYHRGGFVEPELQPGEQLDELGNIIPYDPNNPPIDPETGKPIKIKQNKVATNVRGFMPIKKMLELEQAEKQVSDDDSSSDENDNKSQAIEAANNQQVGEEPVNEQVDGEEQKEQDEEEEKEGEEDGDSKNEGDDQDDDKSFLSSSDSNSESDEAKLENIKDFGRILGYAMMKNTHKEERYCNCCYENHCCIKFWNLMARSAKFFEIINIFHNIAICYLCWNFQETPKMHVMIQTVIQSLYLIWLYLSRPYQSKLVNFFLLTCETMIWLFMVGLLLKSANVLVIPNFTDSLEGLETKTMIHLLFYVAFQTTPSIAFYLVILGFVIAVLKGLILFVIKMAQGKTYAYLKFVPSLILLEVQMKQEMMRHKSKATICLER